METGASEPAGQPTNTHAPRPMLPVWLVVAGACSGGYAAGAIGAIILGGLIFLLARRRRAQLVTALVLVPLVFITGSVMRTEHIRQKAVEREGLQSAQAATAAAQRSPTQQKAVEAIAAQDAANPPPPLSAAECAEFRAQNPGSEGLPCNQDDPLPAAGDDWSRVALAFEQAHPEIKVGGNQAIMQHAADMLATPGMSSSEILQRAYDAATRTTGWTPVVATTTQPEGQVIWDASRPEPPKGFAYDQPTRAAAPVEPSYVERAMQAGGQCIQAGGNAMACFADASPVRCKAAAVAFIGNMDLNRRALALCLQSCADAGLWSRTAGDCRK